MRTTFFTLLILIAASINLWAQPANDDCNGIIDLGVAPYCPDDVFFSNENATASDIGNDNDPSTVPDCAGLPPMQHDVWFQFIASDTIDDYTIEVIGLTDGMGSTPLNMPQVAIYRGDCEFDGLQLLGCNAADIGENSIQLNISGLTPGLPYFLRITDYSESATPNWGTFKLCVRPQDPVIIIDDNIVTDLCEGEVYDSGGPDGNYSANENYTLTIQPPAPTGCITFTFEYYNIDETSEQIIFYDGPNTSSPIISTITGSDFSEGGGGAVCYQVQASSGALTMQFISDANVELDGFHGYWECSQDPCVSYELIQAEVTQDTTTIVNALTSPQTQLTITSINCADGAMGVFSEGDLTDLGLTKGLLLTSGNLTGVSNPGTFFTSQGNGMPGDPDLDFLSDSLGNGTMSFDACILELDVYVATDQLNFEYIFGSEEYPEYVNSSFNDIFAFLISGPGIDGSSSLNNQLNIAVLPDGSNTFVQINSVNNLTNWEYYRNNMVGPSVAYDGLTSDYLGVKKSLTAHANVIPCNTYHLKLAIADRGDSVFDSGVFISEIRGAHPQTSLVSQNGVDYLAEECTLNPDLVIFELNEPTQDTLVYDVQITGTATPNVDYTTTVPSQITFLPGESVQTFQIAVLSDGIPEGEEYVTFLLVKDFGCGEVVLDSVSISIFDELQVEILHGVDTAFVCEGGSINISATGAANYFWTPISVFDNPGISNPVVTPPQSMLVYVVGSVGPCTATDSVWLEVIDPNLGIGTQDPTGICQGDTIFLYASNNVGNSQLMWTPLEGIVSDPTQPGIYVAPLQTTTYTASVELEGCSTSDEITIFVDTFDPGMLTTSDTTICQGYPVTLAEPAPDGSTTDYLWTPGTYLNDSTIAGATALPEENITYTLISTSENAYCADTASINIEVIPADVTIVEPTQDSLEICLGDSVQINTATTHTGIVWMPEEGLSDPLSENPLAAPTESVTYVASLVVGECVVYDSIHIRVDSLPDLAITADPMKDPYCAGEQVLLYSPTYEPIHFPDINFQWEPASAGLLTPDTLFNLVLLVSDTITMTRYVNNRGCVDSSSITLNVIPSTAIEVTPQDTSICPGDSVQLLAINPSGGETEWTWEPSSGLSCTDCPDPVATPDQTIQYFVSAEIEGCPSDGPPILITVYPPPQYLFPSPAVVCAGESIELNLITDPNATYTWLVNGVEISTDAQPVVSPTETTTYTLVAQYQDCSPIEDQVTVEVVQEPQLTISEDQVICLGDVVTLSADGGVTGTYFWQPTNDNTASIQVAPSQSGWYVVTFEDAAGCFVSTDSVFVDVGQGFFIDSIYASPDTVFEGQALELGAFTEPEILTDPSYLWALAGASSIGNSQIISISAPSVEGDDEGVYVYYELIVSDAYGCTDTAHVNVLVLNTQYQIPLVFSPNGDQTNDLFKVYSTEGITIRTFKVYNRWGQLVYGNEDGKAEWDGTQNGKPAPSDVYVYLIELELGDGRIIVEKGDITLLR